MFGLLGFKKKISFKGLSDKEINEKLPRDITGNTDICVELGKRVEQHKCPVCLTKDSLLAGPKGGAAINIKCDNCKRVFWYGGPFGAYFLRQEPQ